MARSARPSDPGRAPEWEPTTALYRSGTVGTDAGLRPVDRVRRDAEDALGLANATPSAPELRCLATSDDRDDLNVITLLGQPQESDPTLPGPARRTLARRVTRASAARSR